MINIDGIKNVAIPNGCINIPIPVTSIKSASDRLSGLSKYMTPKYKPSGKNNCEATYGSEPAQIKEPYSLTDNATNTESNIAKPQFLDILKNSK